MIDIFEKQPAEVVAIDVDFWTDWLSAAGPTDSISTAVATAATGITLGATTINTSTSTVKQLVSGGTSGTKYLAKITVTTVAGLVKEYDFYIKVKAIGI